MTEVSTQSGRTAVLKWTGYDYEVYCENHRLVPDTELEALVQRCLPLSRTKFVLSRRDGSRADCFYIKLKPYLLRTKTGRDLVENFLLEVAEKAAIPA